MSRALTALRYLVAPFVGLLSPDLVATLRQENARADAAELNEARAKGERDEARRAISHEREHADGWRLDSIRAETRVEELEHEIETLRSELASSRAADEEHVDLAASLADVTRERDALLAASASHAALVNGLRASRAEADDAVRQLRSQANALSAESSRLMGRIHELETQNSDLAKERDRVQKRRDDIREAAKETQRDLDAARAEIVRLGDSEFFAADAPEPVNVETCAWCLGKSSGGFYVSETVGSSFVATCDGCFDRTSMANIAARAIARAASCLARQDSADPLAKACPTCLAPVGKPCDLTAYRIECATEPDDGPNVPGSAGWTGPD